jgi:glycolate oxidase FAD binding subunit
VIRVAAIRTALPAVIAAAAECGGALVGRAALGTSFIQVDHDQATRLRQALSPSVTSAVVLDGAALAGGEDVWGTRSPGMTDPALELMRRVKARFDPSGTCNPGLFVGGI